MKNKNLSKKLILNKQTVANLDNEEMIGLWGGVLILQSEEHSDCLTCVNLPGDPNKDPVIQD